MKDKKNIKCLIVDDEVLAQQVIEKYLSEMPDLEIVGKCKSAMEAMQIIHNTNVDLMFLDINMPKMSGMSFLKTLKNPPLAIMTTAYREYALESFELDVVDYLHKPFSFERFFAAVNKAVNRMQSPTVVQDYVIPQDQRDQINESFIFVKSDKVTYKVNFKDIYFIESVGDYVKIFTKDKVIITYQSLKNLESILPPRHFPRVHKSFIVAISQINSIRGNEILIKEFNIPIGRNFRQAFFDLVQQFSGI
jgi:two-component system, LytTR family, response regulator